MYITYFPACVLHVPPLSSLIWLGVQIMQLFIMQCFLSGITSSILGLMFS